MPDVDYDFGVSSAIRSAFSRAATQLAQQRPSRAAYRTSGLTDFKGHFSTVFSHNGGVQLGDLDEIVTNLRVVSAKINELEDAARAENRRRDQARAWARRMAARSDLEKMWDGLFGSEQPPVSNLDEHGPTRSISAPVPRPRETPASGGAGTRGTSSARPEELKRFTANTHNADEVLKSQPGTLQEHCQQFSSRCRWATLDASSVIAGLGRWLAANGQDAVWAQTVAVAFEWAGSHGGISTLPNSAISAALAARGIAENRTDIQIDPPTAYGSPPTTGYADDPVNTSTGNFIENETDLAFAAPASALGFTRCYSSLNPEAGGFGPGWSSWTECGITLTDDAARLLLPDGRAVVFPRLGTGWDRATGENLWLTRRDDTTRLRMRSTSGATWDFSDAGRLLTTDGGNGDRVDFSYDASGHLKRLTHEFGRAIDLAWDEALSRVTEITSTDGRRVAYRYDEAGHLVSATSGAGARQYRWNPSGLIEAVVDADGVIEAENVYDTIGRVASQRSQFGRVTRFAYLPGGITVASDADGGRANTWIADTRGRLIGVIDADDRRQSTSYDRFGNPVMVTERDGVVTLTDYDSRGRTRAQMMPSGARLAWAYDDADRPVEVSVSIDEKPTAVTRYTYEGTSRNPSIAVDPSGGVTRMTWDRGLLKDVVDPTGVRMQFRHDEHGDLIATTDADGNTARLERDAAGRVIAAITPMGHRTSYLYDQAGLLVARTDPDGARWTYEHTAGGRIAAVVDPTGGRTAIEHGTHGARERVTDPLGRQVATSYDDLGNLAAVELPDGTSWGFSYDASSRLTGTRDAAGGAWKLAYGPNGQVSGAVDATGVERSIQTGPLGLPTRYDDGGDSVVATYDRLGRVVSVTGPDGQPTLHRYDLCGRLVETVDAGGGVTLIGRDAAGRVAAVTQPMGGVFRYEYDACGRWAATVSTGGERYQLHYDADGRVVAETWPTGERVTTELDECGRVLARTEPGRGTTRFRYDRSGRIIGVRDPWHGHRTFRYDNVGQLVEDVNARGGVTRYSYDELGRQTSVTDPLGGRTIRTFDGLNRLLTQTDPLGRVTHYTYDASGRPVKRRDATGTELCWSYDASGRLSQTSVGDRVLSSVERDFAKRVMTVAEGDTVHELAWDANGNLRHRLRNGEGVRYGYDAGGRRTRMVRPDGAATEYSYDANNRLAALSHQGLGRAFLGRDELGRITSLDAEGLHTEWAYADGQLVARETNRRGFISSTRIERDGDGRIHAETVDGLRTTYDYDPAGQLIGTHSAEGDSNRYTWDANGRLAAEATNGRTTAYRYDQAGQLREANGDGGRIEYDYDAAGRRTRRAGPDGEELFAWDPLGYLSRITEVGKNGDRRTARSRELQVDALGELARIDQTPVWWDSAAGLPSIAQLGTTDVVNTGIGAALAGPDGVVWSLPDALGGGSPWAPPNLGATAGVPAGVMVTASAGLHLDGLDWLQARAYDATSRGFLSTDPLPPVTAAPWSGNPYSFAGNDPVNASDPLGLRPVTDAELQGYRDANRGALGATAAAVSDWWGKNWEYVAAGALIVGGIAVMCTGIGGPIGAAMIAGALTGAGGSIWSQKSSTGTVNWGRVAVDGALGAATGLIGGGAGAAAARATSSITSCLGRNILSGAIEGGLNGGASGGLTYLTSGQPITVQGLLSATADGAGSGAVLGGASGALAKLTGVARYGCFTADTGVLMADGTTRPISAVEVGDEVASFNPETGEVESRRVTETFVHESVATIRVKTTDGDVTSTINHRFYVEGKGWLAVGELQQGDRLRAPEGQPVEVVSINATGRSETVFNLQVEGFHNYHVSTGLGTSLLVHNNNPAQPCNDAAAAVVAKVDDMTSSMTAQELKHTTYAAAHVTLSSGEDQLWVAGAGRDGYVRPLIRGDSINVKSPALGADLAPHINDAEMHISRAADAAGANINAIGATRDVCGWCQERLPGAPFVTPLKGQ